MSQIAMLEAIARVAVGLSPHHAEQIIIDTKWWPNGPIKIEAAVMSGGHRWTIIGMGATVEAAVVQWVNEADRCAPGWSNR